MKKSIALILCIVLSLSVFALCPGPAVSAESDMWTDEGAFSMIIKNDGTLLGVGKNRIGQLGDGTYTHRTYPVQVKDLYAVKDVAAGPYASAALKSDGTVWVWGRVLDEYYMKPYQIKGLNSVKDIACGYEHFVAVKKDGTVWSWGGCISGSAGNGKEEAHTLTPVKASIKDVIAVSAGWWFTVALKKDGTVWAWGWNFYRQLGDGTEKDRFTPVQAKKLNNITAISSGNVHTIALQNDGRVWSWGDNELGQMGNGTTSWMSNVVQVKSVNNVSKIFSSGMRSYVIKKDGSVWIWGLVNANSWETDEWVFNPTPTQVKTKDGTAFSTIVKAKAATGLKLNKSKATLEAGAVTLLTATISPKDATERKIKWSSSNSSIAKVDQNGVVTAKTAGSATITAKLGGLTKVCTVTVTKPSNYVSLRIGKARAIQNGKKTTIDSSGTKPFKISGRTMVPVRFISEKMGAKVKYKDDKSPITVTYGKKVVSLKLGDKKLTVSENNKTKTIKLEVAAQKKNGRTFLPLRAIGEALGFAVYYDNATEIIVVSDKKMSTGIRIARVDEAKAYITR